MTSLSKRLQQLETLVSASAPESFEPPEEWLELLHRAMSQVLDSMSPERAERAAEAISSGGWLDDMIAMRVVDLALSAVPRGEAKWFPWPLRGWICTRADLQGPLVLPEASCRFIEEHPQADFDFYQCRDCGFRPGEDRRRPECVEHNHPPTQRGKVYVAICPACGGEVGWTAYQIRLRREKLKGSTS